jgi:hypothetical protein
MAGTTRHARRIAQSSSRLCDADSPLYARLPARTLRCIARATVAALHGEP